MSRLRTLSPAIEDEINRMGLVARATMAFDTWMVGSHQRPAFEVYIKQTLARKLGREVEQSVDFDKLDTFQTGWYNREAITAEVVIMSKAELALLLSQRMNIISFR